MYITTRRTSTILVLVVVAATALTVLTSATFTSNAFAAKTDPSANKNLKNFLACESNAASRHFGQLTENELMDCYSQAFPSSFGASGNNNNSPSDISRSTKITHSASTSITHAGSSISHTHLHHHNPTSPS